jgi:hypothetical protein
MGVTAQLDFDPAVRSGGQIGRHDGGGAPVEVPRRLGHAFVAERSELGQPDFVLGQDPVDWIMPAVPLVPLTQIGSRRQNPGLPPDFAALGGRGREVVPGRHECGRIFGLAHNSSSPLPRCGTHSARS